MDFLASLYVSVAAEVRVFGRFRSEMRPIFDVRKGGKGEFLQDHVLADFGTKRGFAELKPIKSSICDRKGECLRGPVDSMCRYS